MVILNSVGWSDDRNFNVSTDIVLGVVPHPKPRLLGNLSVSQLNVLCTGMAVISRVCRAVEDDFCHALNPPVISRACRAVVPPSFHVGDGLSPEPVRLLLFCLDKKGGLPPESK